nr:MAG TPA: hypothetical protein [Caudoviricetes sp.]
MPCPLAKYKNLLHCISRPCPFARVESSVLKNIKRKFR